MNDVTRRQAFGMVASGLAAGYCYLLPQLEWSENSALRLADVTNRFTFTPGQGWRQAEETTERK